MTQEHVQWRLAPILAAPRNDTFLRWPFAMSRSFRRFLARKRRNPLVRRFARHAESYVRGYNNFDYDPCHNGELFLLRMVSKSIGSAGVIFDVGANVGDWTSLALTTCPTASIHAFEIVPNTAKELRDRTDGEIRVQAHAFGLADKNGTVPVKIACTDSTRATLISDAEIDDEDTRMIDCVVQRGDDFVRANEISYIDLLKIDTEGGEPLVLRGFSKSLKEERIGAIQFEYGRANAVSRFLLADFYDLLKTLGFDIGKLYPNYVDFRLYSTHNEDFIGPNYVAIHRNSPELRRALTP